MSGTEAKELGLVLEAVPGDDLDRVVDELIARIVDKGSNSLRRSKELVNAGLRDGVESGLRLERELIAIHMMQSEARNGIQRFLDRPTRVRR